MDTLEGAIGYSAGIYTAAWFWNPCIAKSSWAGTKTLWIANWGVNIPMLPRDWIKYKLHQYLANGDGLGPEYGATSKDMDLSTYNGSLEEFNLEYGLNCQPLIPNSKKYAVCIVNTLNIRENAGANYKVVSYLYKNDTPQILSERVVGNDIWLNIGWKQWVAYKYQGFQYMVYV
jgi:hypothetical protein